MTALKQTRLLAPLFLFIMIAILLWRGLYLHPNEIPSPLINKPIPVFQLPILTNQKKRLTNSNFIGHITLLNVWATWCRACIEEHNFLLKLASNKSFVIIGLNYKDNLTEATNLLNHYGNPYQIVAIDKTGNTAIDLGVYGTPETFVIDTRGIIRYKQIGPVTQQVWDDHLKPLIESLKKESK